MKTRGWRMTDGGWLARSVLECGSPLPLSTDREHSVATQSARGLAQSKTWRNIVAATRQNAAIFTCISPRRFAKRRHAGMATLALCLLISAHAIAQQNSIDWYKVSGGGGTSTGSTYQVSAIGQHDAGGAMTGGNYSLIGGFWSLYAVQTPGAPLLTITYIGNQAIVSWSPSVVGWTLQTNANLATPTWGNYLGAIVNNSVTNAPPTGNLFFRLTQ